MNTGNNPYSTLSQSSEQAGLFCCWQIYLEWSEYLLYEQYELQYSESYVDNFFGNGFPIEGSAYCATLTEAFRSLCTSHLNSPPPSPCHSDSTQGLWFVQLRIPSEGDFTQYF